MPIKKNSPNRLDANESAFFARQLEYIKSQTYDEKYKPLDSFIFIPVSTEIPSGAREFTYRQFKKVGFAKVIHDFAHDFPRVDIHGVEVTTKIKSLGDSYGYTIEEIRAAAMAGFNLNPRRAQTAEEAHMRKADAVAWLGDSVAGLNGFISNDTSYTEYTLSTGASGDTFALKTPDEIIVDLSGIVSAVIVATNKIGKPDTMLLPVTQYLLIANTRMTGDSNRSILKYFLENNPYIKTVAPINELSGAGAGSTDRMMVYQKDPRILEHQIPQMFEQFEADKKGMEYEVPCHSKTAGVTVYYPTEIGYCDGI